jgi:hypothetical protein
VVDLGIILFADVAILRLDDFAEVFVGDGLLGVGGGRERVGRGVNGFAAEFADAGLVQYFLGLGAFLGFALALGCFGEAAAFGDVGAENFAGRLHEADAIFLGEAGEEGAVGGDGFEEFGGGFELRSERAVLRQGFLISGHR